MHISDGIGDVEEDPIAVHHSSGNLLKTIGILPGLQTPLAARAHLETGNQAAGTDREW